MVSRTLAYAMNHCRFLKFNLQRNTFLITGINGYEIMGK